MLKLKNITFVLFILLYTHSNISNYWAEFDGSMHANLFRDSRRLYQVVFQVSSGRQDAENCSKLGVLVVPHIRAPRIDIEKTLSEAS